jgi:glutamate N-acetyltransferase/amino-acid N-acetyltransferase
MKKNTSPRKLTVKGFQFAGISSGIKKKTGDKDLALIFSEVPASTVGMFTTNKIKAAPVKLAMKRLYGQKNCQAIIINSGNANACTGQEGMKHAREMTAKTAGALGISPDLVHVSSTGVIGVQLPIKKISRAIPDLVRSMSPRSLADTASAIMTTDSFPKVISKKVRIGKRTGTIVGITKGAGMICPNMATMLCYILTDISISSTLMERALKEAVDRSFNRLAVDNDMSTNDSVFAMANGLLGNDPIKRSSKEYKEFRGTLSGLTYDLAKMIARDGEGATKLIEVIVKGAKSETDADKVARAISGSMLVKTAVYGNDPNWGRIVAAAGYSGVNINENKIDIYIGRVKVMGNGVGTYREKLASRALQNKTVIITVDLGSGDKMVRALSCDLTEKYIAINAEYRT